MISGRQEPVELNQLKEWEYCLVVDVNTWQEGTKGHCILVGRNVIGLDGGKCTFFLSFSFFLSQS